MSPWFSFVVIAVLSYLLGSVNFAIIVSRIFAKEDVRTHGSGNAGMTNMLRTYGKLPAAVTAIGDFLKGAAAVVLSRLCFHAIYPNLAELSTIIGYAAGLFVLLGHVRPLYFGFRGGKGVMTTLGVMLALNPLVFIIICVIFVPIVFITKIVSIASVLGAISYPIITYITARLSTRPAILEAAAALVYTVIILAMHHGNIRRLLNGTENKFGSGKK